MSFDESTKIHVLQNTLLSTHIIVVLGGSKSLLSGELTLNIDWDANFSDANSKEFENLRTIVHETLLKSLQDEQIDLDIKTIEISFR